MSDAWIAGDTAYHAVPLNTVEKLLGAERVFAWTATGKRGFVVSRGEWWPLLCSCDGPTCQHREAVAKHLNRGTWQAPTLDPRPAA